MSFTSRAFPPSLSVSDGSTDSVNHPPGNVGMAETPPAIVGPPSRLVPGRIATESCLASPMTPTLYVSHDVVSVLTVRGVRIVQAGML